MIARVCQVKRTGQYCDNEAPAFGHLGVLYLWENICRLEGYSHLVLSFGRQEPCCHAHSGNDEQADKDAPPRQEAGRT